MSPEIGADAVSMYLHLPPKSYLVLLKIRLSQSSL